MEFFLLHARSLCRARRSHLDNPILLDKGSSIIANEKSSLIKEAISVLQPFEAVTTEMSAEKTSQPLKLFSCRVFMLNTAQQAYNFLTTLSIVKNT